MQDQQQSVNLKACLLLLVAFAAAEMLLYDTWRRSAADSQPFIPKFAMVLLLLFVLTLPKTFIVMSYFMHLKFERLLLISLATLPFFAVATLILTITADIRTIAPQSYTQTVELGHFQTVPPPSEGTLAPDDP